MNCPHCHVPWKYHYEYCPDCRRNYGGAVFPAKQTETELADIDALILRIQEAFVEVSRGDGETLHQACLEDFYDTDEPEWITAGLKDPEEHWSDVPDWKLESGSTSLYYFNVAGWQFYLPAFMCWSLRNWRASDTITADSVIWNLTLSGQGDRASERYASLNRDQSEVVCSFLYFFDRYSGDVDARIAIESYWHKFKCLV